MRRKRAAARAAGGSAVPTSARKALAGKLQRAAASLKAKTPITKRAKKKPKPVKKPAKKRATKASRWCTNTVRRFEAVDQTARMKSRVHPTYKTKYRVKNWASYDRTLVRRGDITIW